MKTTKIVAIALSILLMLSVAACGGGSTQPQQSAPPPATPQSQPAATTSGATFTPGTYTGTGSGYAGTITVEVEFSEDAILSVNIVSHNETPGVSDPAFNQVPSQIVEFQNLNVDAVSGATISADAIVAAVTKAANLASNDISALLAARAGAGAGEPIHKEVDVVVVGGGGAGMSAAIIAREMGADVVLMERTSAFGGNTLASGAGFTAWNAIQPERLARMDAVPGQTSILESFLEMNPSDFPTGFDNALVTLQGQIRDFFASGDTDKQFDSIEFHIMQTYQGGIRNTLDGERIYGLYDHVRVMVEGSNAALEWMESLGGRFEPELGEPVGSMWRRAARPETNNQTDLFDPMIKKVNEIGVDIMLNTRAENLIIENGTVVGVTATMTNGTHVTVRAKSVVLATGGFASNLEMVAQYNNFWEDFNPIIGSTNVSSAMGDGIIMAQAVGADVIHMGITQLMPIGFATTGALATGHARGVMYVGPDGKRFVNEMAERDVVSSAAFGVGGTFYEIRRLQDDVHNQSSFAGDGTNRTYVGPTLEELAVQLGMDPAVLVAEVEKFNGFVAQGRDEDFGRVLFDNDLDLSNSFMARVLAPSSHYTGGGLRVTTEAQVLNTNGQIIPNLFAAGEIMGGIHGGNRLGGNAIAEAFVFGHIAGEMAANNAR